MKIISEFMKADHKKLDEEMESVLKSNEKKELLRIFSLHLKKHMEFEEKILFPLFEKSTKNGNISRPTSVLLKDHSKIRNLLEKLEILVRDKKSTHEKEQELFDTLRKHEKTEFGIVYPWLDQAIEDETAGIIITGIKNYNYSK